MASEFWTGREPIIDADEIDRRRKRAESQAALIFALLMGAFAALGFCLIAYSEPDERPAVIADCANVEPAEARLTCFDTLARDRQTPFKGEAPIQNGKTP